MPNNLTTFSLISLTCLLPQQLASQETTADGYPAPPGVYGKNEILKNTQLNLGTGAPYLLIENNAEQSGTPANTPLIPQKNTQTAETGQTKQPKQDGHIPARQAGQQAFRPMDAELRPVPAGGQAEQPLYQTPAMTTSPHPGQYTPPANSYPDAAQIRQLYQDARQLPFDKWGNVQEQGQNDYGSQSVPINPNPQTGPSAYYNAPASTYSPAYPGPAAVNKGYPQFTPPPSAAGRQPSSLDPRSSIYNPGELMEQFFAPAGNTQWMPPAEPFLRPTEQFPVPQLAPPPSSYGLPSVNHPMLPPGSNFQFMRQIPEDEIIYPPSYPGRR